MNRFGDPHPRPPLPRGPFLVVGLARSGAAIARLLAERGERVLGCDSGRPGEAEGLPEAGVEVSLEVDGTELLDQVKTLVKSPGVPQEAPVVKAARERGVEVTGELELAWRLIPNRIHRGHRHQRQDHHDRAARAPPPGRRAGPVAVAGNVGTPLASLVGKVDPDDTVVCEASSFQLEDSEYFAPECAVLLNLAPDHLDRHGTLESYIEAKLRIFANQGNDDVAVYNGATPELQGRDLGGCARLVRFCPATEMAADPDCEVSMREGVIFAGDEPLLRSDQLKLLGRHNVENAMAAAAAALATGIPRDSVVDGLSSFEGVPHRLERLGEHGGVLYVNDSKATNVASAIAGIEAFEGGVHLILGGSLKGESFEPLLEPVEARCRACYLIGEAAEQLSAALAPARVARGGPDRVRDPRARRRGGCGPGTAG